MDLLKLEQRSVIKILTKDGSGPQTIYDPMSVMCAEHMSSYYDVEVWSNHFKWGSNLMEDGPKSPWAAVDSGPK